MLSYLTFQSLRQNKIVSKSFPQNIIFMAVLQVKCKCIKIKIHHEFLSGIEMIKQQLLIKRDYSDW